MGSTYTMKLLLFFKTPASFTILTWRRSLFFELQESGFEYWLWGEWTQKGGTYGPSSPTNYLLFIFSKRAFHPLSYSFFGLKNGLVSCCPLRPPSHFFGLVTYHTFLIFVDRCPHSNKRFNNPFRIWIENAFHHWLLWIKARSVGIWSRQSGLVAFPDGRRPESKKIVIFNFLEKNCWKIFEAAHVFIFCHSDRS